MSRRSWFPTDVDVRKTVRLRASSRSSRSRRRSLGSAAARAQTGELNWPSKQIVRPRDIAVNYPCGGGSLCNIDDFMERQHVCALVVISAGELVLLSHLRPRRTTIRARRRWNAIDTGSPRSQNRSSRCCSASSTRTQATARRSISTAAPPTSCAQPACRNTMAQATLRQLLHMSSGMEWSEDEIDATMKIQVDQNGDLVGKHRKLKDAVDGAPANGANSSRPASFTIPASTAS